MIGAGVAGCGGGGDDDAEPTPTATTGVTETVAITTDDLITEGDALCGEVNAAIAAIDASTADETTKSSQRSDLYQGIADGLTELGTPSDGEPPTEVISEAEDLANGSTDVTAFQTAAAEYGFTECTEAPEISTVPTDPGTGSSTGTDPSETYVPPTTEVPAEPVPVEPPPSTGGGVAPTPAPVPTPTPPSGGGSGSGGIGPG